MLTLKPGLPALLASTEGVPSVSRYTVKMGPPEPARFRDFAEVPTLSLRRVPSQDEKPAIAIHDTVVSEFNGQRLDPIQWGVVPRAPVDIAPIPSSPPLAWE